MPTNFITNNTISEWFSVNDKLPEGKFQYEYVLTYSCSFRDYYILYYLADENQWHNGGGMTYEFCEISHWMPLPTEPNYDVWFDSLFNKESLCKCSKCID